MINLFRAGCLFLVLLGQPLIADTLVLKSGGTIEGDITSEDNVYIQIRVANAARTIFDNKSIFRTDVKEIVRSSADQKAYQEVVRYRLGAGSFPVTYYDQTIQKVFQKFLTDYPSSTQAVVVADTITQWKAERDKVASGAIKWGNHWYEGDDVKFVANLIKVDQIIEAAARLIGSAKYEEAVAKYQEALAIQPLPASAFDLLAVKMKNVLGLWKASAAADSTALCATLDTENQSLTTKRAGIQGEIAQATTYRQYILNARSVPVPGKPYIKHWYSDGYGDFGSTLPDPVPIANEIAMKQATIKTIDETIAANTAKKTKILAESASVKQQVAKIDSIQQQFNSKLDQARADIQRLAAEDAQRKTSEALRLAAPATSTQTQLAPSQVTEPSVAATVATAPSPEPVQNSIWTWLHSNWALLLIIGIPVVYLILRLLG